MSPVRTRGRSSAAATCPSRVRADGSHKHSARGPRVLRAATNVRGLDPPFEAPRRARLRLHMVEVSVRTHWMACTATQGTSAAAVRRFVGRTAIANGWGIDLKYGRVQVQFTIIDILGILVLRDRHTYTRR